MLDILRGFGKEKRLAALVKLLGARCSNKKRIKAVVLPLDPPSPRESSLDFGMAQVPLRRSAA
jgi:hypothetical protein